MKKMVKKLLCNYTLFGRRYNIYYAKYLGTYHFVLPQPLRSLFLHRGYNLKNNYESIVGLKIQLDNWRYSIVTHYNNQSVIPYVLPTGRIIYIDKTGVRLESYYRAMLTDKLIARIWKYMYWQTTRSPFRQFMSSSGYYVRIPKDFNRRYIKIGCSSFNKKTVDTIYKIIQKLNKK